jgi:hypothetical protein
MSRPGSSVGAAALAALLVAVPTSGSPQSAPRATPAGTIGVVSRPAIAPPVLGRSQVEALLGPLRLVRPLASETLERLIEEGESVYRARNLPQAFDAFATVVELEPDAVHAWLRLGNLHQQAGRHAEALNAYRQAVRARPRSARDDTSRGKALLNVAMFGIAQAEQALETFERDHDPDDDESLVESLVPTRDDAAQRLADVRRRADRHVEPATVTASRGPVRAEGAGMLERTPAARPRGATVGGGDRAAADPPPTRRARGDADSDDDVFEPYTVDRWTGRARRAAVRPAAGRGAWVEPVSEVPSTAAPAVEMLRGVAPGRARP